MLFLEIFRANCREHTWVWPAVCCSLLACSVCIDVRCCFARIGSILIGNGDDAFTPPRGDWTSSFAACPAR